jgi:hypothetical protein
MIMMNSPLPTPASPSNTIRGSRHVERVSVDGKASLVGGGNPDLHEVVRRRGDNEQNRQFLLFLSW